jgi:hypothetical protein
MYMQAERAGLVSERTGYAGPRRTVQFPRHGRGHSMGGRSAEIGKLGTNGSELAALGRIYLTIEAIPEMVTA